VAELAEPFEADEDLEPCLGDEAVDPIEDGD
jgi:hypothetical protein